jgi:DNA-binding GntR family transcriptional regulator
MPAAARRKPVVQGLGRADRSTLQDRIYDKLTNAIMSGLFVPGQPITIRGLAATLGTSPIPVREAIRRLTSERALEVLRNGSIAVPKMTRAKFEDLRRSRILIEGFATELAARNLTRSDIGKLEDECRKIDAAKLAGRRRDTLLHTKRFRFIIYEATRSGTLVPIIESLWLQVGPLFNLVLADPAVAALSQNQRRAVRAFKRGDPKAARAWIERDIMEAGDRIIAALDHIA